MTLGELKALVNAEPTSNDRLEVKAWLPGSYISLVGANKTLIRKGGWLLIEGNLDEGSALEQL
jgi:hypothetical protein